MSQVRQRTDFSIIEFERIISEKGLNLLHEKALLCSCINEEGQNLASCEFCNNSGRRYVGDPVEIKAIVTGMNRDKDLSETGMNTMGTVNVTTFARNRLSFLDKLTLLDGKIVYNEVIETDDKKPSLKYPLLSVELVADLHRIFVPEVDYDIINGEFVWLIPIGEPYSIRYITYPVFIVLNFPNIIRGTITKLKRPDLIYTELPVKAMAKLEFRLNNSDIQ